MFAVDRKHINNQPVERLPIKVLFGVTLSEIGGAQRVVFDIISTLPEEHYDITLVTAPGGELIQWINKVNIKRKRKIKIIELSSIKRELSGFYDIKATFGLYKIIKAGSYDIVHFHSSKMGILGRIAAKLARITNIYFTVHGWGINDKQSKIKRFIFGTAEKLAGRISTKVICVSEEDRIKGIRNGWIKEKNSCVIHNGISPNWYSNGVLRRELKIHGDIPILGMVARLKEPKEPLLAIKVVRELKNRGQDCRLVIIGDGPLKGQCEELIDNLELQDEVILLGRRDDIYKLLPDIDIFTLFSKWEGLPICILEAMATGLPVVASSVGGIPELIQSGKNGYLLKDDNIEKAADYIESLLINCDKREKMGHKGRDLFLDSFSIEKMTKGYEKVYTEKKEFSVEKDVYSFSQSGASVIREIKEKRPTDRVREPSVKRNFSWLFTGNFAYAASRGILLMILAKLGTPMEVGEFTLALAINTPIFMLADLKLRTILATDTKDQYEFSDYAAVRLLASGAAILISLLIVVFLGFPLKSGLVVVVIAFAKAFESISDLIAGLLQKKLLMDKIGKSLLIKSLFSSLSMGIIFYFTRDLLIASIGLALAWAAVLIFYDSYNARCLLKIKLKVNWKAVKNIFKASLPLGFVLMIASVNLNIPNYFIKGYLGSHELGYYSSIFYIIAASDIVINSLCQSLLPTLASSYWDGLRSKFFNTLIKLVISALIIGGLGVIISTIFGKSILTILYRQDYSAYSDVFILLMIGYSIQFISICLNNSITAARLFKIQPYIYSLVLLISIAANAILVSAYGLRGAAYAGILTSAMQLLGNLWVNIKLYRFFTTNDKEKLKLSKENKLLYKGEGRMDKLLNYGIYLNILILSVAFIEPSPSDIVFVLLIGLAMVNRIFDKRKITEHKFAFLCFAGYLALSLISIYNAEDMIGAIKYCAITAYLFLYAMIILFFEPGGNKKVNSCEDEEKNNKSKYSLIFKAYITGSTISAVLGILGYVGIASQWLTYDSFRTQALFKDPNVFGPFLIPTIIILIDDIRKGKVIKKRAIIHVFLLIVNIVGIILSFSRGSWACLAGALLLYLILNLRRENLLRIIYITAAITITIGVIWMLLPNNWWKQFLVERLSLQLYDSDRFTVQLVGIGLGFNKVVGYGPGQFETVINNSIGIEHSAHSLYVRTMLESGSLSLLLLIAAIGNLVYKFIRVSRYSAKKLIVSYSAIISILAALIVNSFVIDTLHWRHFWLFIGVGMSMLWDSYEEVQLVDVIEQRRKQMEMEESFIALERKLQSEWSFTYNLRGD